MEAEGALNCVLFDHIMLESREKAKINNYDELMADSKALTMAVRCIRETFPGS